MSTYILLAEGCIFHCFCRDLGCSTPFLFQERKRQSLYVYLQLLGSKCHNNEIYIYISLRVKCTRTVFTHELLTYQKKTSERSERVSSLIQKTRVRKYRTKHFPCCNLFILYLLRFSPFIWHNKCQVMYLFV